MNKKQIYMDGQEFREHWTTFIKSKKSYVGAIPVLEDTQLSTQARIMFHIISSVSVKKGYCCAVNSTLSEKIGLKETMIKKYLRELEKAELIITQLANTKAGFRRRIFIDFETLQTKYTETHKASSPGGMQANVEEWVDVKTFNKQKKLTVEEVRLRIANKKSS